MIENNDDDMTKLTGDMAHKLSRQFFKNIIRLQLEQENLSTTVREADRQRLRAEITEEVCIELMDALILSRYDYIVRNAVIKALEAKV